jgi:hypothetical protein
LPLQVPVEKDGAALAGAVAQSFFINPHLITGPPGQLEGRTHFLILALENVPAGSQHHEVAQAGKSKPSLVDEMIDLLNLFNVKRRIESVIGILFPDGFDKPLFLVLPDAFLGEVYHTRDVIDEVEVSQADLLIFPSRHNLFYKKEGLDSHYQKNLKFQEKRPLEPAPLGFLNTRKRRLSWST